MSVSWRPQSIKNLADAVAGLPSPPIDATSWFTSRATQASGGSPPEATDVWEQLPATASPPAAHAGDAFEKLNSGSPVPEPVTETGDAWETFETSPKAESSAKPSSPWGSLEKPMPSVQIAAASSLKEMSVDPALVKPKESLIVVPKGVPTFLNAQLQSKNEKYYRFGWKIHLNVPPDLNDPLTKRVSEYLTQKGIPHKVGKGGECGKGLTAYIGSRDTLVEEAKALDSKFGEELLPAFGDTLEGDTPVVGNVWARFEVSSLPQGVKSEEGIPEFSNYGPHGLLLLKQEAGPFNTKPKAEKMERGHQVLANSYGEFYTGSGANALISHTDLIPSEATLQHSVDGYNQRYGQQLTLDEWKAVLKHTANYTDDTIRTALQRSNVAAG